jgi:hypothetical protein
MLEFSCELKDDNDLKFGAGERCRLVKYRALASLEVPNVLLSSEIQQVQ